MEGCRHFIGIDGCFLKGPYPGQLLTAVGIDGNNGIYPFVYVVVEKETKHTWTWFLEQLRNDIRVDNVDTYTFISDQQKVFIFIHFKSVYTYTLEFHFKSVLFQFSVHNHCISVYIISFSLHNQSGIQFSFIAFQFT